MNGECRTVTVHCVCQREVAGHSIERHFVWESWADSGRRMNVALDVYSLHLMYTFIYSFYKMLKYFVYHKCVFCNITLSRQNVTSISKVVVVILLYTGHAGQWARTRSSKQTRFENPQSLCQPSGLFSVFHLNVSLHRVYIIYFSFFTAWFHIIWGRQQWWK